MVETVRVNPYIGPTSFTENDSYRFFGRAEETRELSSLVIARRAVLLYAQSGSGKTSLLQAALIPELKRRKRVETFAISRVTGGSDTSSNVYVENALSHLFPDAREGSLRGKTFSEAFSAVLWSDTKSRRQPHLVIFDQFEEIFTYHPELTGQRESFFAQLGECLSTYPQLSLLLSMREDYLADLEGYSALLPDRMRTRMRLERLGVDGAVEAIREPAALAGLPFAAGTAEQLVDNLRRIRTGAAGANGFALGLYVEPVQLQIVCRQLWSKLPDDATTITAQHIETLARVDDALTNFYRDSLTAVRERLPTLSERVLRLWFGEHLITSAKTRGMVYQGESETEKLPNAAVEVLREKYILRADIRPSGTWYELAHDRLVEPILADNLDWRASYKNPVADALERWTAAGRSSDRLLSGNHLAEASDFAKSNSSEVTPEERDFLETCVVEARKSRRRRQLTGASVAGALLLLSGFAAYAAWQAKEANTQHRRADESLKQVLGRLQAQVVSLNGELAVSALDELSRARGDEDALGMVPPESLQSTEWFANVSFALEQLGDREAQRRSWAQNVRRALLARFLTEKRMGPPPSAADDKKLNDRITISGSSFQMGSASPGRPEEYPNERPQHRVTLSPFLIQEHQVTNREYRRFLSSQRERDPNHNYRALEDLPVVKVSWHEAMAYAAWLGGSLPTEAQWEFAARGKEGRKYPWGEDDPTCDLANYLACGGKLLPAGRQGGKTPERVYGLAGNAWEWCRDWYGPTYPDREQKDPLGPATGSARVVRGGAFNIAAYALRSAYRYFYNPVDRTMNNGFRVVWD